MARLGVRSLGLLPLLLLLCLVASGRAARVGKDEEESEYEGADLLDRPTNQGDGEEDQEMSGDELFAPPPAEGDASDDGDVDSKGPQKEVLRSSYKDLFPQYSFRNPLEGEEKILPGLIRKTGANDFKLSQNAHSNHVAAAAKVYAADVSKRTFTILLEEQSTVTVGSKSQSTFILMDIIKLFCAPFVAVLYTPVGEPLSKGMGGGKVGISSVAGMVLGAILAFILGPPLGLILGICVANLLTEALTFTITWQTQSGVLRRVTKIIVDGVVRELNDYLTTAATPTMRDITRNLLIDVLSDTITNALHHTLIKSVSERVSSSLTPATTHYYYCVYCYYYGDYCDICFRVSDYDILHRMWTIGQAGEQWTFDGP